MATSPMRITGLGGTGLDTDALIKQLMTAERAPLNKLFQNKQIIEWKQTDYRTLNSKLLELRNQAFDMRMSSAYKQFKPLSSNESIVKATATPGASPTSYVFNSITSLAKASNIATADGQSISRDTSVVTGGTISMPIDTNTKNTFKINVGGAGFVDITLDPGKVYDGTSPGGKMTDLVNDIQTKLNAAGLTDVQVSLTKNNNIQFTSNDYPGTAAPKTIVLQEGAANDLLKAGLGFSTDSTTKQISSTVQKIDVNQSIYTNLQQHRFKNTEDFGWIVNGSDVQTLAGTADNISSTVAYNNTNITNYAVTTTEKQSITVGAPADNFNTTYSFDINNYSSMNITVNGTKYTAVTGKAQADLGTNEVLVSDDGTGKVKLTFKNQLATNDKLEVNRSTSYTVVTGKAQADLAANEALLTDDGSGKAKFTFKKQLAANAVVNVDRHDFEFSTSAYNQDGTTTTAKFTINAMIDTMNSLASKISGNSTAGLLAFYDTGTDKMVLTSKKTGDNNTSGNDITLTGNFLTGALQMTKYTEGSDAVFTLNGLDTTRKDNSFTISGVTFNLAGTTTVANPVTVSVSQDVDKTYNMIKSFIDKYNETIGTVNSKLSEARYRDYTPLTDEQKESMKDADIQRWEDKAKSGLLNNDSTLSRITSDMRKSLYDQVDGVSDTNYSQLAQIGITTSPVYQDRGKLIINETKLREAIANNPDNVVELFTKVSTSTDKTQQYKESGLAVRIYNNVLAGMTSITDKAGSSSTFGIFDNSVLGKQKTDIDKNIYNLQSRLTEKENNYYKKFSALETALNKMNSQSSWLAQQFGGK